MAFSMISPAFPSITSWCNSMGQYWYVPISNFILKHLFTYIMKQELMSDTWNCCQQQNKPENKKSLYACFLVNLEHSCGKKHGQIAEVFSGLKRNAIKLLGHLYCKRNITCLDMFRQYKWVKSTRLQMHYLHMARVLNMPK